MSELDKFKEWADRVFGSNFKMEELLTYHRMSAAYEAGYAKAMREVSEEARKKLEEALTPMPPREGIYPWAIELEPTARHANYWIEGGRNEPEKGKAILCVEQGVNSWKNACYHYSELAYKLQRENESLQAEITKRDEERDSLIGQQALRIESLLTELNYQRAAATDSKNGFDELKVNYDALQTERARMVEACDSAINAFVTQVGSDYNDIVHSAYLRCRDAISNSAEHAEKWLAEVRMKAYADALEDAIDICQDQQGNEENDDFAYGFEAGCKECEEGIINQLANELREVK